MPAQRGMTPEGAPHDAWGVATGDKDGPPEDLHSALDCGGRVLHRRGGPGWQKMTDLPLPRAPLPALTAKTTLSGLGRPQNDRIAWYGR